MRDLLGGKGAGLAEMTAIGIPVPAGFTADKLPVGLQIVGRRFDDVTVLRAAHAFEKAQPWAHLTPPFD